MTDPILEIGAAGLESTDQRVRKMIDNMALSQIPGAKKSDVVIRGFPVELEAAMQRTSAIKPIPENTYYNQLPGALIKTGNKLDLALGPEGYFVIQGLWGEGYTRDGRFRLDKDGQLITVAGSFPVLGYNGPIVVTPGANVEFTQTGELKIDGATVDRLRVIKPESKDSFDSLNGVIFKKIDNNSVITEVANPRLIQGYMEASNVNIVDQMMDMITLEKIFNMDTKLIQYRDSMLSQAMDLGKAQ